VQPPTREGSFCVTRRLFRIWTLNCFISVCQCGQPVGPAHRLKENVESARQFWDLITLRRWVSFRLPHVSVDRLPSWTQRDQGGPNFASSRCVPPSRPWCRRVPPSHPWCRCLPPSHPWCRCVQPPRPWCRRVCWVASGNCCRDASALRCEDLHLAAAPWRRCDSYRQAVSKADANV
jgi:hypothetical protein